MLGRYLGLFARLHQDLAQSLTHDELFARLQRCAAYAFLRASIRISRSRLPRMSSSPGCSVIEAISMRSRLLGVLASWCSSTEVTMLGLLEVRTSIRGSPSRSCLSQSATVNPQASSSHVTTRVG